MTRTSRIGFCLQPVGGGWQGTGGGPEEGEEEEVGKREGKEGVFNPPLGPCPPPPPPPAQYWRVLGDDPHMFWLRPPWRPPAKVTCPTPRRRHHLYAPPPLPSGALVMPSGARWCPVVPWRWWWWGLWWCSRWCCPVVPAVAVPTDNNTYITDVLSQAGAPPSFCNTVSQPAASRSCVHSDHTPLPRCAQCSTCAWSNPFWCQHSLATNLANVCSYISLQHMKEYPVGAKSELSLSKALQDGDLLLHLLSFSSFLPGCSYHQH